MDQKELYLNYNEANIMHQFDVRMIKCFFNTYFIVEPIGDADILTPELYHELLYHKENPTKSAFYKPFGRN